MSIKINPITEKGTQIIREGISKQAQKLSSQGIDTGKALASDVVEISFSHLQENLAEIEAMRNAGVTQTEIAERFGVGRGSIQKFLSTHLPDATSEGRKFVNAIRNYFSAKTTKEKNDTFIVVDQFLQKYAKERCDLKKISYDDYLQDLRLKLMDTAKENAKNPDFKLSKFAYELKKGLDRRGVQKETPVFVPLSKIKSDKDITVDMDFATKMFENDDYLEKSILNSDLSEREKIVVQNCLIKNKTYEEVGDWLGLTRARIGQIFQKSLEKLMSFKDLPKM